MDAEQLTTAQEDVCRAAGTNRTTRLEEPERDVLKRQEWGLIPGEGILFRGKGDMVVLRFSWGWALKTRMQKRSVSLVFHN